MDNILDSVKRLHFVGIGGSGMCPMAELLMNKGYEISGSDMSESDTLDRVKGWGIPVFMGHRGENIGDAQAVVYTAACKADNPELVAAREKGVPTLERSVMLGMLTVPLLLNIEPDHLDYFKTLENIVKSFRQFAVQTDRLLVVNASNPGVMEAVAGLHKEIVTFGLDDSCDYYPAELNEEPTACEDFTLMHRGKALGRVDLAVPGKHNMLNALAAAAAAHSLGIEAGKICSALEHFGGVHRRFEILGQFNGVTVADDFAHHPTELTAVLSSAMRMGYKQVWAVFQPHTYSRTYTFLDDFAKALSIPDHLVMTEILAVREENVYGIHTSDLAAKVPGSVWFDSFDEIAGYVMEKAQAGDLILTLGGGDIYKCANLIVKRYQAEK